MVSLVNSSDEADAQFLEKGSRDDAIGEMEDPLSDEEEEIDSDEEMAFVQERQVFGAALALLVGVFSLVGVLSVCVRCQLLGGGGRVFSEGEAEMPSRSPDDEDASPGSTRADAGIVAPVVRATREDGGSAPLDKLEETEEDGHEVSGEVVHRVEKSIAVPKCQNRAETRSKVEIEEAEMHNIWGAAVRELGLPSAFAPDASGGRCLLWPSHILKTWPRLTAYGMCWMYCCDCCWMVHWPEFLDEKPRDTANKPEHKDGVSSDIWARRPFGFALPAAYAASWVLCLLRTWDCLFSSVLYAWELRTKPALRTEFLDTVSGYVVCYSGMGPTKEVCVRLYRVMDFCLIRPFRLVWADLRWVVQKIFPGSMDAGEAEIKHAETKIARDTEPVGTTPDGFPIARVGTLVQKGLLTEADAQRLPVRLEERFLRDVCPCWGRFGCCFVVNKCTGGRLFDMGVAGLWLDFLYGCAYPVTAIWYPFLARIFGASSSVSTAPVPRDEVSHESSTPYVGASFKRLMEFLDGAFIKAAQAWVGWVADVTKIDFESAGRLKISRFCGSPRGLVDPFDSVFLLFGRLGTLIREPLASLQDGVTPTYSSLQVAKLFHEEFGAQPLDAEGERAGAQIDESQPRVVLEIKRMASHIDEAGLLERVFSGSFWSSRFHDLADAIGDPVGAASVGQIHRVVVPDTTQLQEAGTSSGGAHREECVLKVNAEERAHKHRLDGSFYQAVVALMNGSMRILAVPFFWARRGFVWRFFDFVISTVLERTRRLSDSLSPEITTSLNNLWEEHQSTFEWFAKVFFRLDVHFTDAIVYTEYQDARSAMEMELVDDEMSLEREHLYGERASGLLESPTREGGGSEVRVRVPRTYGATKHLQLGEYVHGVTVREWLTRGRCDRDCREASKFSNGPDCEQRKNAWYETPPEATVEAGDSSPAVGGARDRAKVRGGWCIPRWNRKLGEKIANKIKDAFSRIATKGKLLHLDLHMGNVMIGRQWDASTKKCDTVLLERGNVDVYLIDWGRVLVLEPDADAAQPVDVHRPILRPELSASVLQKLKQAWDEAREKENEFKEFVVSGADEVEVIMQPFCRAFRVAFACEQSVRARVLDGASKLANLLRELADKSKVEGVALGDPTKKGIVKSLEIGISFSASVAFRKRLSPHFRGMNFFVSRGGSCARDDGRRRVT